MKPTMPMNAFPPGGPPGTPPPGGTPPQGGGWGPPPGGGYTPPPSYGGYGTPPPGGFPQQAPPKSKTGLYVGVGCGCLLLLACIASGGVWYAVSSMGPGEEVTSTNATIGQPFTVSYVQSGSQKYDAWLEVDVHHTAGYQLTSTGVTLSENNVPFGQYTIDEDGTGGAVPERNSSTRTSWTSTNVNGNGNTSGTVSLFPIPARTAGGTITVSGTINASPGTTGTVRIIIAKRD